MMRWSERCRLEWWIGDGGDPAVLLAAFLADQGLPAADVLVPASGRTYRAGSPAAGAILHMSAAACALIAGGTAGAPTPVPAVPDVVAIAYDEAPPMPDPRPSGGRRRWRLGEWEPSWTPREHADAVRAVRSAIADGDVYQVNVVGHASAPYDGEPGLALQRVANLPGARYPAVLSGSGWALGCASPETLLAIVGSRILTRPIKGTKPATARGRVELLGSAKERAEHIMIVDLARNDLARVARTGSVRVEELYAIRRWSDLWQAETVVSAELASGIGLADVLRALCPGGSVTGAPKLAALQQIAALEPVGRGPSMGALGWIGRDRLDLGLTIRTVAVDADRVHVWAGGGITWGSDPDAEVAEAEAKAEPVRAALAGR